MDRLFDARAFLSQLESGRMDGRLEEEIRKLSTEELQQIASLMGSRLSATKSDSNVA